MGRKCIIGQSGGATVAINATLVGVVDGAKKKKYDKIYGMENGLSGLLDEKIMDLTYLSNQEIERLKHTPAMYLGSCRFKIPHHDDLLKQRIIDILLKYQIDDFFYIGGNDSMDTVQQLSKYAKNNDYDIRFIGIPKTIDNDLLYTDYTPGYPSACKYVATSLLEIAIDSSIYPLKSVTIVEIMGRDAGWLTAASQLVNAVYPQMIDLIYLPEITFDKKEFIQDVKNKLAKKDSVIVAVSEGIKDSYGMSIALDNDVKKDAFGHISHSGCGEYLKRLIADELNVKVRSIQLSTLQRCAAHLESEIDITNSYSIGNYAVECAIKNLTGIMIVLQKTRDGILLNSVDIDKVANKVKYFPDEWIDKEKKQIKEEYIRYVVPFIYQNGYIELPKYLIRNYKDEQFRKRY